VLDDSSFGQSVYYDVGAGAGLDSYHFAGGWMLDGAARRRANPERAAGGRQDQQCDQNTGEPCETGLAR
jgi:hypothetical protein